MTRSRVAVFLAVIAALPMMAAKQSEFKVNPDGFSFENYRNKNRPVNLTPETLERLCGPRTCARGTKSTCVLSGAMRAFMDQLNEAMANGHCDGMAALSELIFKGEKKARDFEKNAKTTFSLKPTPLIQSEIAYFWSTQLLDPTHAKKRKNLTPNQMIDILRNTGGESYSIHMFNPGYKDGHAVTAIKVVDLPKNMARVHIYDSNYPNMDRYISVDKSQNTWTYVDFPSHKREKKFLFLVPLSARLLPQKCPVLANNDSAINDKEKWDVQLNSDGLEFDFAESVGGAAATIPVTDTRASNFYLLKPGEKHIKLKAKGSAPTSFYFKAHGHVISLEKILPRKGMVDEVILGADGETLRYRTLFGQPLVLRLAATYSNADFEIKIMPTPRPGGFDLYMHNIVDPKEGNHVLELQLRNHDGSPNSYTLKIKRIGPTGDTDYSHRHKRDLTILPNEIDRIQYGKWLQDLQPLSILDVVNGRVERENLVSDED